MVSLVKHSLNKRLPVYVAVQAQRKYELCAFKKSKLKSLRADLKLTLSVSASLSATATCMTCGWWMACQAGAVRAGGRSKIPTATLLSSTSSTVHRGNLSFVFREEKKFGGRELVSHTHCISNSQTGNFDNSGRSEYASQSFYVFYPALCITLTQR